jgi:hypothetical protein
MPISGNEEGVVMFEMRWEIVPEKRMHCMLLGPLELPPGVLQSVPV